ncbi:MAG TPA: hypothetical protein VNH11_12670 [Pirellulales bacterium]|nr:hypothetical protein [Pirellulales bacterium]HVA47214.1 hypothetical protein [Pirellulales bacterium]
MASLAALGGGFFRLLPALWLTLLAVALASSGGCQSSQRNSELAHTKNGVGGALTEYSVAEHAQRNGISNEEARRQLQQKVGQRDEEQALDNIDEAGTRTE